MKYIVVGPTIVNDIYLNQKLTHQKQIGGAIFALQGVMLWNKSALYVSNVGEDFLDYYGRWIKDNDVSLQGLYYTLPHTQYTNLHYAENELHSETSVYGEEEERLVESLDHISAVQLASHIAGDTKGIYLEISDEDSFWNDLHVIREQSKAKVMWEIRTSSTQDPVRAKRTLKLINKVDIYSLNFPEAQQLFGIADENAILDRIQEINIPCYLRFGARGSAMIADGECAFVPSLSLGDVVDTTGSGNASTAAAMVGFCENDTLEHIARRGNISGWFNLTQKGPYPKLDEIREQAEKLVKDFRA
ncbi:MAG TPA: hypothetical protein DD738_13300 [Ruminiclostridium sp.]|mgnify:CR=1 FL=1|nr:hypothetical protein [Ruminiclostridium sp.]